jgi:hypothetical protein
MAQVVPPPQSARPPKKKITLIVLAVIVAAVVVFGTYYYFFGPGSITGAPKLIQIAGTSYTTSDLSVSGQPLLSANITCPASVSIAQTFTCNLAIYGKEYSYVQVHSITTMPFTYVGTTPSLPDSIPYGQTNNIEVQMKVPSSLATNSATASFDMFD